MLRCKACDAPIDFTFDEELCTVCLAIALQTANDEMETGFMPVEEPYDDNELYEESEVF